MAARPTTCRRVQLLRRLGDVGLVLQQDVERLLGLLRVDRARCRAAPGCGPSRCVSETDGAFFSSSWRIERTMRAIWSARLSVMSGHLGEHDLLLALQVGVVDVEVEAAALERLGQLAGVVRREEHQRDLLGVDRAQLGDRHLVVGEDLEQQRLGLDLDAVDLVDQQHDRILGADGLEQRAGEQELVGEDVVVDLAPRRRCCGRPGCAGAASCSSTRRAPWTRRGPRSTAGG